LCLQETTSEIAATYDKPEETFFDLQSKKGTRITVDAPK